MTSYGFSATSVGHGPAMYQALVVSGSFPINDSLIFASEIATRPNECWSYGDSYPSVTRSRVPPTNPNGSVDANRATRPPG